MNRRVKRIGRAAVMAILACVPGACGRDHGSTGQEAAVLARLDRVDAPQSFNTSQGPLLVEVNEAPPPPPSGDLFPGDDLVLHLRRPEGQELASCPFHSSYGKFSLEVVQMDGRGLPEFVLIRGEGRGISARRELLEVMTVAAGQFHTRLITPLSDHFGDGAVWRYRHSYRRADDRGDVEIHMALEHTPLWNHLEDPSLIPPDPSRTIRVSVP